MKYPRIYLMLLALLVGSVPGISLAGETLDKAKEGVTNLMDKTGEVAEDLVEDGKELGQNIGEKAKESGGILWDKMKDLGGKASDLANQGMKKLDDLHCDPETEDCELDEETKDDSI